MDFILKNKKNSFLKLFEQNIKHKKYKKDTKSTSLENINQLVIVMFSNKYIIDIEINNIFSISIIIGLISKILNLVSFKKLKGKYHKEKQILLIIEATITPLNP